MAVQPRNVLTVFIASPGDVEEERKAVKAVADILNRSYSRHSSWQIDVLGWEDTLPGFGRPQTIINSDVEACDLFVGMLWKRWGQPTGKYSSGFEEELDIAKRRRSEGSLPEIWLFFKNVEPDQKGDAGPQLKRVLEFKQEIYDKKEILSRDFSNVEQFKEMVSVNLNSHLLELIRGKDRDDVGQQIVPIASLPESSAHPESMDDGRDVSRVLGHVRRCLDQDSLGDVELFERARLKLFSDALYGESSVSALLGIHEINVVYRKSSEWSISDEEWHVLLRTALGDSDNVCPAWRWRDGSSDEDIDSALEFLATVDGVAQVRIGAIRTLSLVKSMVTRQLFEIILQRGESAEINEALSLMVANEENAKHADLLDNIEEAAESSKRQAVQKTRAMLLFKRDASEAVGYLASAGIRLPETIESALRSGAVAVQKDVALEAISKGHPTVRRAIAGYLKSRNELGQVEAAKMVADSDAGVRRVGVEWLIENGKPYTPDEIKRLFPAAERPKGILGLALREEEAVDPDLLVARTFETCSKAELVSRVDLYSVDSSLAYEVLLDKWCDEFIGQAREHLEDDFGRMQRESEEMFAAKYGSEAAMGFREKWDPSTVDFLKARMAAVILKSLAEKGQPDDIRLARKEYDRSRWIYILGPAVVALVERFGDETDVAAILDIAERLDGEDKRRAVQLAVRLSREKSSLLQHENIFVRTEAIAALAISDGGRAAEYAKEYLASDREELRKLGVGILIETLSRDELISTLDEYMRRPTYFYNVVTWLDRALFSPDKYSRGFVRRLREQIGLKSSAI